MCVHAVKSVTCIQTSSAESAIKLTSHTLLCERSWWSHDRTHGPAFCDQQTVFKQMVSVCELMHVSFTPCTTPIDALPCNHISSWDNLMCPLKNRPLSLLSPIGHCNSGQVSKRPQLLRVGLRSNWLRKNIHGTASQSVRRTFSQCRVIQYPARHE